MIERSSASATKAAALYDRSYAQRYRAHDDTLADSAPYQGFVRWLKQVCDRFSGPVDALDLGCGTGRYFSAVPCARTITGVDASAPMLQMARTPIASDRIAAKIRLVLGDLVTQPFAANSFDLVYSIGVLAEHAPLDAAIVQRVHELLRKGGRFAFSTVHPESPSVRRTVTRRLASAMQPLLFGASRRWLHRRLIAGGAYADERWITELLRPRFVIESLERFVSEAHLHCLCVARKDEGA